jgi:hypothetical protein
MRRTIAAAVLTAVLALPAGAAAQQGTTTHTAPAQTSATTAPTTAPATTPLATTPLAATAPSTTTTPAGTPAPASQPTTRPGHDRAAVVMLLLVGALALLAVILWALARWQAWDPDWVARWRHATGEAGWRAGNAWAEFTDWLRIGR